MATPCLFAVLVGLILISLSEQYVPAPTCFGQVCPASTSTCKEYRKSSPDRIRIQIKISCLDDFDASVKEYYFEEASHLDRYTFYENTRRESVNEGITQLSNPYPSKALDLTPNHQGSDFF